MTCQEARRLLSPYLDSELDAGQTFEIGLHLQECEACRTRFASEQEVDRKFAEHLKTEAMPDELWDTLQRRVLSTRRRAPWFYWSGITALAACILIAIFMGRHLISPNAHGPDDWLVNQFQTQTDATALVDAAAEQSLGRFAEEIFQRRIRMNIAAETTAGHKVELLRVTPDSASGGRTLLVHLRCCGEPVLVAIGLASSPGPLADLAKAASASSDFQSHRGDINVAAWKSGDLIVAAVSRHPVAQLENAFRLAAS